MNEKKKEEQRRRARARAQAASVTFQLPGPMDQPTLVAEMRPPPLILHCTLQHPSTFFESNPRVLFWALTSHPRNCNGLNPWAGIGRSLAGRQARPSLSWFFFHVSSSVVSLLPFSSSFVLSFFHCCSHSPLFITLAVPHLTSLTSCRSALCPLSHLLLPGPIDFS